MRVCFVLKALSCVDVDAASPAQEPKIHFYLETDADERGRTAELRLVGPE